jgi:two-component system chemotaxis response regulator CheB
LTGMGEDGARGLLSVRHAGGVTLCQDEATSLVFGMPRAAVHLGAAEHVLPIDSISHAVAALCGSGPVC